MKRFYLIGEEEEYRCRREARGAGEPGAGDAAERARRGDAGAELLSRDIAPTPPAAPAPPAPPAPLAAFFEERDASNRKANCSNEPGSCENVHMIIRFRLIVLLLFINVLVQYYLLKSYR